jgi:adenosine deaminase CECR1
MSSQLSDFEQKRREILEKLEKLNPSTSLKLSEAEKRAAGVWEILKHLVKSSGSINLFEDLQKNFSQFSKTRLYQMIRAMPKGVLQHCHLPATLSLEGFLEVFNHPNVHYSQKSRTFNVNRVDQPLDLTEFFPVLELRKMKGDAWVDQEIRDLLVMNDRETRDRDTQKVFAHFNKRFSQMGSAFYYEPVLRDFIRRSVADMREDNILGAEIRNVTVFLVKQDLSMATRDEELGFYKQMKEEINASGFAMSWIHTGIKEETPTLDSVKKWLEPADFAYSNPKFKDVFVGVDMVDYEGNHMLYDMRQELVAFKERNLDAKVILHAGESTDKTNKNVVDAILLGSARLGHGINLSFNPAILDLVKERNVCVEINLVSNFMLGFMRDAFWHPLRMLINTGVSCALSSDDCLFWDVTPLSMDFFVATIYCDLTLAEVKWLLHNSIDHSYFSETQKSDLHRTFAKKWDAWISTLAK